MTGYFSNLWEKWLKIAGEVERIAELEEYIENGCKSLRKIEDGSSKVEAICDNLADDELKLRRIKNNIFWRRRDALFGKND